MFYLLDQPTEDEFQILAQRYQQMSPSSVKAAVTLLKTGSDLLTGFEKMLGTYGLSQGRFLILMVMNRQPGEAASPSILAEKIGVTRATMTGLITGLVKEGLIRRSYAKADRRRQKLRLTAKGKALLEEILPDYWSRIRKLTDGLNEAEKKEMVRLLNKIAAGIPALTGENNERSID